MKEAIQHLQIEMSEPVPVKGLENRAQKKSTGAVCHPVSSLK